MGFIFHPNRAAKEQARATRKAAALQAQSDGYAAQAAQQAQEAQMARENATTTAKDMLSAPMQTVDVNLAPDTPDAEIDPVTGRRRTARSSFMFSNDAGSGIKL